MKDKPEDSGALGRIKSPVRKKPVVNSATKRKIAHPDAKKRSFTTTTTTKKPNSDGVPPMNSKPEDTGMVDNDQVRSFDGTGLARRSQNNADEKKEPDNKRTKIELGDASSKERYVPVEKPHIVKKFGTRVLSPPPKDPRAVFDALPWGANKTLCPPKQPGTYLSIWKRAKDFKSLRSETVTDGDVEWTESFASEAVEQIPLASVDETLLRTRSYNETAASSDRSSDTVFTEHGGKTVHLTEMEFQTCLRLNSLARNIEQPGRRGCYENLRWYGTGSESRTTESSKRTANYDANFRTRSIPAAKEQRPVMTGNRSASESPIRMQGVADSRSGDNSPSSPGSQPCGLRRSPVSDALCTEKRARQLIDHGRPSEKKDRSAENVGYFEFAHSSCSTNTAPPMAQKAPNQAIRALDTSAPLAYRPSRERKALKDSNPVPMAIPQLIPRSGGNQRNRTCSGQRRGDRTSKQSDGGGAGVGRRGRGQGRSEESTRLVRSSTVVLNHRCDDGRRDGEADSAQNATEITVYRYSPSPRNVENADASYSCADTTAQSIDLNRSFRNRDLSLRNPSPTKASELRRMSSSVHRSRDDGSWSNHFAGSTQSIDEPTTAEIYDLQRVHSSPVRPGLLRIRGSCASDSESPSPQRRTRTLNSESDDPARLSPARSARFRNVHAFPSCTRTFLVDARKNPSNSTRANSSSANRSFCSHSTQSSPTRSVNTKRTFLEGETCLLTDASSRLRRGGGVARSLERLRLRPVNTSDSEEQRSAVGHQLLRSDPSGSPPDRLSRPKSPLTRLSPGARLFRAHAAGHDSPLQDDLRFCSTPLQELARGSPTPPLFLSPIPKSYAAKEFNVNSSNTSRLIRVIEHSPLRTQTGARSPEPKSSSSTRVVGSPKPPSSKCHNASSSSPSRPLRPDLSRRTTWKISYDADVSNASLEGALPKKKRKNHRRLPPSVCRKFKNWSRAVSAKLPNGRITRIPVATCRPFFLLPPEAAAAFRIRLLPDMPARSFRYSKLHRKAIEVLFPTAIRQLPMKLLSRVIS